MKKLALLVLVVSLMSAWSPLADARASEGDWEVRVIPFLWATSLTGELGPAARPATVDLDFSDILDVTEAGFVGEIDATYKDERFFGLEAQYLELEETGTGPMGASVKAESTFGIGHCVVGKRIAKNLDLYAGGRYIYTDTDVSLAGAGKVGVKEDWIDPIVGFRITGTVSEKMFIRMGMDVGGFGVNSDFTYAVLTNLNYTFNDTYSAIFGYRMIDIEYDKNDFVFDAKMDGLVLGLGITF